MKTRMVRIATGVLVALTASMASATLVNIDIDGQGSTTGPVTYSGAAAIGSAGDIWNSYAVDCTTQRPTTPAPSGTLVNSTGGATSVTFQLSSVAADIDGFTSNNLLRDVAYIRSSAFNDPGCPDSATITIGGLTPNGNYDLYLYCAVSSTLYGSSFTIGSTTLTQTAGVYDGTLTAERDYVKFSNVNAGTTGSIAVAWIGSSVAYAPLGGVQIQSVPEPASLPLAATGLFGLLAYAWRKRR